MTDECFGAVLNARLLAAREMLAAKATEYATGLDRLHNFKRAAAVLGGTPAQACIGFFTKHLVSVLDLVDDETKGVKHSFARIDEKIGDAINYLILLEAILKEGRL